MSRTAARFTQADVARSIVYFVAIGKHIKIGVTTNLDKRLKAFLTSATQVEVLLTIPGDRALEQSLHEKLAECRIERELFHREWRVLQFIHWCQHGSLEQAMEFLDRSDPAARARQKAEDHTRRVAEKRKTKAEKDAYFASLVAERKSRIGW